jgi:hypothetical protein
LSGESFEKWTSGTKNVFQILIVIFALILFFNTRIQQWLGNKLTSLSAAGVESVKVGELEFKLTQARQAALQIANNPPATPANQPRPVPQDKPPTPGLAPALEAVSTAGTFWVYLGQYQGGKFLHPPNFTLDSSPLPKEGDLITAATDVYERSAQPVKSGIEWRLGNIVGVVRQNQMIVVRQIVTIEDGNVWLHADAQ